MAEQPPSSIEPVLRAGWFGRMIGESLKKPIELVTAASAGLLVFGFAATNLMVNRYLMVFGEPGLAGFGDIAGLLPSIAIALALPALGLLMAVSFVVAAPLFTHHVFAKWRDNPLAQAFAWPADRETRRGPALVAYLAAHGPLLALSIYLMIVALLPEKQGLADSWWILAYLIGLLAPAAFVVFVRQAEPKTSFAMAISIATLTSALLSLFALIWFGLVLTLAGDPTAGMEPAHPVQARLVILATIALVLIGHWMMTVAGTVRRAVPIVISTIVLLLLLVSPGDRLITFMALRSAGIGGGTLNFYRNQNANASIASSQSVCLILPVGELRIVKLARTPEDCDRPKMQAQFVALTRAAGSQRQALLKDIRVFKREAFIDASPPRAMSDSPAPKTP